jgi:hypothetical protein
VVQVGTSREKTDGDRLNNVEFLTCKQDHNNISAGKSTLACALSHELHSRGHLTYVLDGDNLRHGLNRDLSFNAEDRAENIRRVGMFGSEYLQHARFSPCNIQIMYCTLLHFRRSSKAICRCWSDLHCLLDITFQK